MYSLNSQDCSCLSQTLSNTGDHLGLRAPVPHAFLSSLVFIDFRLQAHIFNRCQHHTIDANVIKIFFCSTNNPAENVHSGAPTTNTELITLTQHYLPETWFYFFQQGHLFHVPKRDSCSFASIEPISLNRSTYELIGHMSNVKRLWGSNTDWRDWKIGRHFPYFFTNTMPTVWWRDLWKRTTLGDFQLVTCTSEK